MNLSDIEKAVNELSLRHPDLTKELLQTLLLSAGWEERNIKEAEIIFTAHLQAKANSFSQETKIEKQKETTATVASSPKEDMTFYTPDGNEEGELVIKDEPVVDVARPALIDVEPLKHQETPKEENSFQVNILNQSGVVPKEIETLTEVKGDNLEHKEEPQSLIVPKVDIKVPAQGDIPENLPLVPFEDSNHVWSFAKYKEAFHGKEQEVSVTTTILPPPATPKEIVTPKVEVYKPEIDLEKTPIDKADESLVVLASTMLLAIMLILGYMYSNGRL